MPVEASAATGDATAEMQLGKHLLRLVSPLGKQLINCRQASKQLQKQMIIQSIWKAAQGATAEADGAGAQAPDE